MSPMLTPCEVEAFVGHEDILVRILLWQARMSYYLQGYDAQGGSDRDQFRVTFDGETRLAVIIDAQNARGLPFSLLLCRTLSTMSTTAYFTLERDRDNNWLPGKGVLRMARNKFEALLPSEQFAALGY